MRRMINDGRRRLLGTAGAALALAHLPLTVQARVEPTLQKASGPLPAFGPVHQVLAGDLEIGFIDTGPRDGPAVILLHGWPYDIHAFAEVAPMLAAAGMRVIVPHLRGYGSTRFRRETTLRNGQQAALAADVIALMDALAIQQAVIAGFDWGARTANIVAALWPERCRAMVSVSGYLIGSRQANQQPLPPEAELSWWYQFYFATERGRVGYDRNRDAFARLIWRTASPEWRFDDETFQRSAASLGNPDHVAITIHNYRWRLGLAEGEAKYDDYENRLALMPDISVPTITMEGEANGAPHPPPEAYASKFKGPYAHRLLRGGVGHNPPQEAPGAFAQAVIDVGRLGQGR
jgi:pimeloyl-ACP methyl ester carboxylesterase